jgi:hypothetical protein
MYYQYRDTDISMLEGVSHCEAYAAAFDVPLETSIVYVV